MTDQWRFNDTRLNKRLFMACKNEHHSHMIHGCLNFILRSIEANPDINYFRMKPMMTSDEFYYKRGLREEKAKNRLKEIQEETFEAYIEDQSVEISIAENKGDEMKELIEGSGDLKFHDIIEEARREVKKIEQERLKSEQFLNNLPTKLQEKIDYIVKSRIKDEKDMEEARERMYHREVEYKSIVQTSEYKKLYYDEIIEGNVLRVRLGLPTKSPRQLEEFNEVDVFDFDVDDDDNDIDYDD